MPDWLPQIADVDPWTANTYEMLYEIFCNDIRDYNLRYQGNNVWIFKDMEDGKEKIFWHLTTRENKVPQIPRRKTKFCQQNQRNAETERLPDLRRCERLPWIKLLIEHPSDSEILAWDYEEGDQTIKTYIWIKNYHFVVIMKKLKDNTRRLITSFYVDNPHKQRDFERKYTNRIQ